MLRRRARGQAGFVITLELVLIFTILGIGLLVGLVAIRNALFKWWVNKQAQTVWVYDSSSPAKVLGPVRDFDEHEAPRLFFIDRNVTWQDSLGDPFTANFRAFIGVRDDRFTGRQRIFYTDPSCAGTPCIQGSGREDADAYLYGTVEDLSSPPIEIGRVNKAGGVGYLYPLQQGPSYGIGADVDQTFNGIRLPGTLYRESAAICDTSTIESAWVSQEVVTGEPCEPFTIPATAALSCPPSASGCTGGASPECISTPTSCSCPPDFPVVFGSNCCPAGSDASAAPGQCKKQGLFVAEPVPGAVGNALADLKPPFKVNLPPDLASFVSTPPTGEKP